MTASRLLFTMGLLSFVAAGRADAQTLTVEGDHFAVDGRSRFLLFVSFYDAMRLAETGADLAADLGYLKDVGYDGIRIFPNWFKYCASGEEQFAGDALFTVDGRIQESRWALFERILDAAAEQRLVVDVSFTSETIAGDDEGGFQLGRSGGPTLASYRDQIVAVATRLRDHPRGGGYRHVFFDLQNEFDNNGVDLAEHIAAMADAVRAVDPLRVVTASTGSGSHVLAGQATRQAGLHFAGVHPQRFARDWWTAEAIEGAIRQAQAGMGQPYLPVHLQEPRPFSTICGKGASSADPVLDHHAAAASHAKLYGAAAWTFHTRTTFDLAMGRYETTVKGTAEETALRNVVTAVANQETWGVTSLRRP
jgi:hypothetical protein